MGFGKAVEGKRRDELHNLVLGFAGDSIPGHPRAELRFDLPHPLLRALVSKRTPQFFSLATREIRADHCDTQQLLLKQRHSQRSFEHRFERWMWVSHPFFAHPAFEI